MRRLAGEAREVLIELLDKRVRVPARCGQESDPRHRPPSLRQDVRVQRHILLRSGASDRNDLSRGFHSSLRRITRLELHGTATMLHSRYTPESARVSRFSSERSLRDAHAWSDRLVDLWRTGSRILSPPSLSLVRTSRLSLLCQQLAQRLPGIIWLGAWLGDRPERSTRSRGALSGRRSNVGSRLAPKRLSDAQAPSFAAVTCAKRMSLSSARRTGGLLWVFSRRGYERDRNWLARAGNTVPSYTRSPLISNSLLPPRYEPRLARRDADQCSPSTAHTAPCQCTTLCHEKQGQWLSGEARLQWFGAEL